MPAPVLAEVAVREESMQPRQGVSACAQVDGTTTQRECMCGGALVRCHDPCGLLHYRLAGVLEPFGGISFTGDAGEDPDTGVAMLGQAESMTTSRSGLGTPALCPVLGQVSARSDSAGRSHFGATFTLRHSRWPRLPREIRPILLACRLAGAIGGCAPDRDDLRGCVWGGRRGRLVGCGQAAHSGRPGRCRARRGRLPARE